jgi:hypothetical protein
MIARLPVAFLLLNADYAAHSHAAAQSAYSRRHADQSGLFAVDARFGDFAPIEMTQITSELATTHQVMNVHLSLLRLCPLYN